MIRWNDLCGFDSGYFASHMIVFKNALVKLPCQRVSWKSLVTAMTTKRKFWSKRESREGDEKCVREADDVGYTRQFLSNKV